MATKAQIARKKYGCSLSELTGGEKAAVTRIFNAQGAAPASRTTRTTKKKAGFVSVKFGRPGVNGTKESFVAVGSSMGAALEQTGIAINKAKEGVIDKSGKIIMYNDTVVDGAQYAIVPGVDSSAL